MSEFIGRFTLLPSLFLFPPSPPLASCGIEKGWIERERVGVLDDPGDRSGASSFLSRGRSILGVFPPFFPSFLSSIRPVICDPRTVPRRLFFSLLFPPLFPVGWVSTNFPLFLPFFFFFSKRDVFAFQRPAGVRGGSLFSLFFFPPPLRQIPKTDAPKPACGVFKFLSTQRAPAPPLLPFPPFFFPPPFFFRARGSNLKKG